MNVERALFSRSYDFDLGLGTLQGEFKKINVWFNIIIAKPITFKVAHHLR